MHYHNYLRDGLPITSSLVESTVKLIGQWVKGTEKFWSENGAEATLQVRSDHLSKNQPLDEFWQRRQMRHQGSTPPDGPVDYKGCRALQPQRTITPRAWDTRGRAGVNVA